MLALVIQVDTPFERWNAVTVSSCKISEPLVHAHMYGVADFFCVTELRMSVKKQLNIN
jgi:hypothetical protein